MCPHDFPQQQSWILMFLFDGNKPMLQAIAQNIWPEVSLMSMFQNCVMSRCGLWLFRSWCKSFVPHMPLLRRSLPFPRGSAFPRICHAIPVTRDWCSVWRGGGSDDLAERPSGACTRILLRRGWGLSPCGRQGLRFVQALRAERPAIPRVHFQATTWQSLLTWQGTVVFDQALLRAPSPLGTH